MQSSDQFARAIGYPRSPVDDLLLFHVVFGKTVPDISLNAIANLGYAAGRFLKPAYPGDTLSTVSEVIGLKENSNKETGTVYVRSTGRNQKGEVVLEYVRWVMVRKRDKNAPSPEAVVPKLPDRVDPAEIGISVPALNTAAYDYALAGAPYKWGDYEVGEKIDHVDGMTLEEAEHQIATRLYQNTAKVHFNQHTEAKGRFGKRIVYGGVAISLARALSFNGMNNAFHIAAINGGRHVAPLFAGDTVYAWSEGSGEGRDPGPHGCGRAQGPPRRGQEPGLLGFPVQERQGRGCRGRHPRPRHLDRSASLTRKDTCAAAAAILVPFFTVRNRVGSSTDNRPGEGM